MEQKNIFLLLGISIVTMATSLLKRSLNDTSTVAVELKLRVTSQVFPSKLDWFLSTTDVLWGKIATLTEFS